MSREIPAYLKRKKEIYRMWRKGQAMWKDCRYIFRVHRDVTRKARACWNLIWQGISRTTRRVSTSQQQKEE